MKKLSIQTRLVLFHTAAMTLVVALVLGLLFSLSSQEILTSAQATLEERVSQGVEEVEYTQGRLEFDSELLSLENGVYLSVYQPGDSFMLYGRLPYGFAYTLPLSDGELRTVTAGGTEYSVLDLQFPVEGYGTLVMRGVVSLTAAERDFRATLRLALVLLPLLVALTALCGYLFSRRALRPVAQITQTVQNIQQERDLSKRVRLGEGRDEIYTLAQTFDSLLDQVEASFRREKQFTSDVAHELRTPLSVALMQCEELLGPGGHCPRRPGSRWRSSAGRWTPWRGWSPSCCCSPGRTRAGRGWPWRSWTSPSSASWWPRSLGSSAGEKGIALEADIQPGVAHHRGPDAAAAPVGEPAAKRRDLRQGGRPHLDEALRRGGRGHPPGAGRRRGASPRTSCPKSGERFLPGGTRPASGGRAAAWGSPWCGGSSRHTGALSRRESALGEGSTFTARLPLGGPEGK